MADWLGSGFEPPLNDILADPIVRALMASDRVEPQEILRLLTGDRPRAEPARAA